MASKRFNRRQKSPPEPAPAPGNGLPTVPGYRDLAIIGRGASATVYSAVQVDFGRTVALKLLHVDVSDRRAQRRFEREKAISGRLSNHPNVVTVLDAGFIDQRYPYMAMEYFEHGSLAARLAERGPFSVTEAVHIGIRIAGALERAHQVGILHRDVKPQNILMSRFGEPALADFGIATILEMEQSMTHALTPVHAAPEILESGEPSPRSDVYSLASTVYTLLAGSPPFVGSPGEGMLAQLLRITTMDLPAFARTDVPTSLFAALRAGTAKRPDERTPNAAAFGRALQQVEAELGVPRTTLPIEAPAGTPASSDHPTGIVASTGITPPADGAPSVVTEHAATMAPGTPADLHPTVGEPEAPTLAGRTTTPPDEAARRRSRRGLAVAAAVLVAIAVGAGGATVFQRRLTIDGEVALTAPSGSTVPSSSSTAPTSSVPVVPGPTPVNSIVLTVEVTAVPTASSASPVHDTLSTDEAALAPGNLRVSIDTDAVVLYWTDTSPDLSLWVEILPVGGPTEQRFPKPNERTVFVVEGMAVTTPACFVVRTFVRNDENGHPLTADSEPECINGATISMIEAGANP